MGRAEQAIDPDMRRVADGLDNAGSFRERRFLSGW
jgi:hypothetical protein